MNAQLIWANPSTITTSLGLAGEHQKINAACAIAAAKIFLKKSPTTSVLAQTTWPGRLQYLQRNPDVLIDGAHNEAGIATLEKFLQDEYPSKKINFVLGVLEDKNWETLFDSLLPMAEKMICVTPNSTRALSAEKLATYLRTKTSALIECSHESPMHSFPKFSMKPGEVLVITGSLYLWS